MPTRAVLFDLDETLLADSAATQDALRATTAFASANTSATSETTNAPERPGHRKRAKGASTRGWPSISFN